MNLLLFLLRSSWGTIALATLIGLLSGSFNAALIALINKALHGEKSMRFLIWSFVGLGIGKLATAAVSQLMLSRFAQRTMAELRKEMCRKILAAPLRQLEHVGASRLLASLTEDVIAISVALRSMPTLAIDGAILVGCFAYLSWLSPTIFLLMLGLTVLGILCHWWLWARAFRFLRLSREQQDNLFRHYRALTEGIKELRIHRKRREAFFSQKIEPTTEAFEKHATDGIAHFILANSWNQLFFYLLIGLILLVLPSMKEISGTVLTGYVLTILYLMGPLRGIMNVFPSFGRANIALEKIKGLGLSLSALGAEGNSSSRPDAALSWKRLELKNVTFAYQREEGNNHFILGPVDLAIHPGEIVFVVGGNGSGKSTLVKLFVGLYTPEGGEIRLDGRPVTDENREWYRQHFSVVFSDFYVFEDLLGLDSPNLDAHARDYLGLLQLDHKVQVRDGVLSTTALSQGQRKRLALLTAYLEERPIYVFDEWAADQDPQFKNIFYTQLLPELKASGKGVLVITHDDRYFHLADHVVKLDYGKEVNSGESPLRAVSAGSRTKLV
jgi:putative ATP-binding cassette transporter